MTHNGHFNEPFQPKLFDCARYSASSTYRADSAYRQVARMSGSLETLTKAPIKDRSSMVACHSTRDNRGTIRDHACSAASRYELGPEPAGGRNVQVVLFPSKTPFNNMSQKLKFPESNHGAIS